MARKAKEDPAQRRLLSMWEVPEDAGAPIGVLATTFTLDTALFEEECLARFAGVESDPTRDGALYRIEREEKLASLLCAAVVADIHHCAGRRSLRWDLLAARPASGVMHAKISLLAWSDRVRAIIGSANLTQDGYRRNQECFTAIDFDEKFTDRGVLDPLLAYLRDLLALTVGPARPRAEQLLQWVNQRLPHHVAPSRGMQRRLVLVGPGRGDLFQQMSEALPSAPPEKVHVVSPFFDPTYRDHGPEEATWGMLKQRGPAELHLHVAGEAAPESGRWRLEVPRHVLQATPAGRKGVFTALHPVQVADVQTATSRERRPLHSKTLTLTHETWAALMVGSSNFTSAGTGLSPRARNWEANVLYVWRGSAADPARRQLETRSLRGGAAVDALEEVDFEPAIDPDGEEGDILPPLPRFFAEAELKATNADGYELTLILLGAPPQGSWTVKHESVIVVDRAAWSSQGEPALMNFRLKREGPPPSVLSVQWGEPPFAADWPVNVTSAEALPDPTELQGLSLAALLDLLSSARPLHEALRAWLRKQPNDDDAEVESAIELIDPHAKVDTSGFLIKRVQRACWAIRQLRERLDQPVLSPSAMAWRIKGPVGATAVKDAMYRQCDPALPDEWAFLLCELSREMREVTLRGAGGRATPSDAHKMLSEFREGIQFELMGAVAGCSSPMQKYAKEALQEVTNAPT
jgi:hypothetical protein